MSTELLQKVDEATSCDAGQALASAGSAWYGLKAAEGNSSVVRRAAGKLSARFGVVAAVLSIADVAGFC